MIHYKACAKTRKEKVADIALMIFGFVAAMYTTVQTIRVRVPSCSQTRDADCRSTQLMVEPEAGDMPKFGRCEVPPTML